MIGWIRELLLNQRKYSQSLTKLLILTFDLRLGSLSDKIHALTMMAEKAYEIKDAGHLKKAMKHFKKIAEDTKLKNVMKYYLEYVEYVEYDMMEVSQELLRVKLRLRCDARGERADVTSLQRTDYFHFDQCTRKITSV